MRTTLIALSILFIISIDYSWASVKIKHSGFKLLGKIPEPSDIVFDSINNHYFIVSDHGYLFECDSSFDVIRRATETGLDFEGIDIVDSFIYVSDETPREIYKYRRSDLSLVQKYHVSWGGAINRAFESISFNYTKKCFVLIAQQPAVIVEYDTNFKEIGKYKFPDARNISGARWHNSKLYLLSSMDAAIFECDPLTYNVKAVFSINVLNPEGLTFDENDRIKIVSDDTRRVYYFNHLPTIVQ